MVEHDVTCCKFCEKKICLVKIGILRLINIKRIMYLFVLKQICNDYLSQWHVYSECTCDIAA